MSEIIVNHDTTPFLSTTKVGHKWKPFLSNIIKFYKFIKNIFYYFVLYKNLKR